MVRNQRLAPWARIGIALALSAFGLVLAWALIQPSISPALNEVVRARTSELGVKNPVTAVLLGFRGYDTLLEVFVVWLAWLGQRQLRPSGLVNARFSKDPTFDFFVSIMVPSMVVFAGYLVWVGADAPGGAFQAAAVLAAAGVLWVQAQPDRLHTLRLATVRILGTIGVLVFLLVASWSLLESGSFLAYPAGSAKYRMLLIEAVAAVSLGWILLLLVTGGLRGPKESKA